MQHSSRSLIHRTLLITDLVFPDVIKLKINKSILSKQLHSTLDSVADEHEAVEEVAAAYDLTKHNSFYVVQRKPLFQDTWLAGERIMFFRDAKGKSSFRCPPLKTGVSHLPVLGF